MSYTELEFGYQVSPHSRCIVLSVSFDDSKEINYLKSLTWLQVSWYASNQIQGINKCLQVASTEERRVFSYLVLITGDKVIL